MVCAVVVTHNRREILAECLNAVRAQQLPAERIIVVDTASTDSTHSLFEDVDPNGGAIVEYVRLENNVGGAGGFYEGIKRATQSTAEWIWLLDDDTIVRPDSLAQLFAARDSFPETARPDLLASRVVWTDGSMHPMNVPRLKRGDDLESMCVAAEHRTLSIRSCSFVSVLFHRRFVEQFGLPIAEYFIWNDDVEYTARILRQNFGVLVPASLAVHKTAVKTAPAGPRFYYAIRNQLWMALRSPAWSTEERLKLLLSLARSTINFLRDSNFRWFAWKAVASGLADGIFSRPQSSPVNYGR